MKKRILFVCMGNICRSPSGEGVFKKFIADKNLENDFFIDSAGTHSYHVGETADARMRSAAAKRGYNLDSIGRQFTEADFENFDLILAMDRDNRDGILSLDPSGKYKNKVKLFCEFHPDEYLRDVPDPYYGGSSGFERVLDIIEEACEPLLKYIQENIN